jgi:hypothetical protein
MTKQLVLSVIEDEGERKVSLLGKSLEVYKRVDATILPQSVVEKIAFLKLTPVNKFAPTEFGRRLTEWHMAIYLTSEEYTQIDNTRKESKGQGSKATEEV